MRSRPYQSYAHSIKSSIIEAKNPRLFPELNIPLSTARHWIRTGLVCSINAPSISEPHDPGGKSDLIEICSLVIKSLESEVNLSNLTPQEMELLRGTIFLRDGLLRKIVGPKLRNKLRQALSPCSKSIDGQCVKRFSSQLTSAEVKLMKEFVTARRYAHMSISSLSLLAIRDQLLLCSSHTWYKYIARHNWQRPNYRPKKKHRVKGLKAKMPNEIWHIDVSEIKTSDGGKYFLQVIYDNFSRYVIAWSLSDRICAANTERLLKRARRSVVMAMERSFLIVDGGTENTAKRITDAVAKFKPTLIRQVARREIKKGNTMIEVFFKMLKSNHLNFAQPRDRRDLVSKISFYVRQHNHIVPMRALDGDTPAESLYSCGRKNSSEIIATILSERRTFRVIENQGLLCQICL